MPDDQSLPTPKTLAGRNATTFPNESAAYRAARNALLAEEIEVRRHIERVAEMRRALPPGGEVPQDYAFDGEDGPTTLSGLFGDRDTLVIYRYMLPADGGPCPMCTSFMAGFDMKIADIRQRIAIAFVARAPIAKLAAAKRDRGWVQMPIYSDESGDYARAYVHRDDLNIPAYNVFTRQDGTIRHFWASEIGGDMADPGQDPRGQPEFDPLWMVLDTTPRGRGTDWYPKLRY